jgi:hypothetical protein
VLARLLRTPRTCLDPQPWNKSQRNNTLVAARRHRTHSYPSCSYIYCSQAGSHDTKHQLQFLHGQKHFNEAVTWEDKRWTCPYVSMNTTPWRCTEEWRYSSMHSWSTSGHFRGGGGVSKGTGQKAEWALEPIWLRLLSCQKLKKPSSPVIPKSLHCPSYWTIKRNCLSYGHSIMQGDLAKSGNRRGVHLYQDTRRYPPVHSCRLLVCTEVPTQA